VWRQFVFAPVNTSRIRVWVTSALQTWSRVTEIEVWTSDETTSPPPPSRSNVALAANGGQAAASSTYSAGYAAAGILNGDRRGDGWGNGGGWNDATAGNWPDWVEVGFAGAKTIDQVDVFSVQDTYWAPSEPVAGMTFSQYGLRDFKIQYWTGSAWADVPGASVAGNTLVWRRFTFGPVSTTKIRIWISAAENSYSRIAEIEVWGQ
jgi:hypothetical protein